MPSLVGLTAREALRLLQGHEFRVEIYGTGIVNSQTPEAAKPIAENGVVKLVLGEP